MKISTPRKIKVLPSSPARAQFTAIERQPALRKQESSPFKDLLKANPQTQNIIWSQQPNSPDNRIPFLTDKSTTTRVQSNQVYDSVRQPATVQSITDWKILTVKQLRRNRKGKDCERSQSRGSKGIQLSISRRNGRSISGERSVRHLTPGEAEGNQFKNLRKLSMKGNLVNKIEIEVQARQKNNDYVFC